MRWTAPSAMSLPRPPSSRVLRSGCSKRSWPGGSKCGTASACGNGTDALLLSLLAVGLQRGDEVIVPAFAFAAVAETVLLLGGVPVFADVDPRTFNIDPASVARLVSERTRVVIPVHLFGQPCDMAALTAVAKEHGLKVIEDNAQSLGAVCRMSDGASRYAGTIGEIGCTSFFPSKVLGWLRRRRARPFTDDDGLAAASGRWAVTVGSPNMTAGWSE